MHFSSAALAIGLLIGSAVAHPGHDHPLSHSEVMRRSGLSKRCAAAAASMNEKKYAKRNLAKRDLEARHGNSTVEITTEAPYYEVIQNDTCVLTPEVTAGPYYWPRSQTLRQDMSESQPGIPLWLDVGVIDMATCEPLENALVDFWHCNATGSYSSFDGISPNVNFGIIEKELNVTDFEVGITDVHTSNSTWLRGMWPTDSNGMMEMKTIFPGFYVERTIHIHTLVHTDWVLHENGTLMSDNIISTGQLYFAEDLTEQVMDFYPYSQHTEINRTTNNVDMIYNISLENDYNPLVNIVPADGENIANGMIGYITIGVDTTAIETSSLPIDD